VHLAVGLAKSNTDAQSEREDVRGDYEVCVFDTDVAERNVDTRRSHNNYQQTRLSSRHNFNTAKRSLHSSRQHSLR
jgi:hypothetical protein